MANNIPFLIILVQLKKTPFKYIRTKSPKPVMPIRKMWTINTSFPKVHSRKAKLVILIILNSNALNSLKHFQLGKSPRNKNHHPLYLIPNSPLLTRNRTRKCSLSSSATRTLKTIRAFFITRKAVRFLKRILNSTLFTHIVDKRMNKTRRISKVSMMILNRKRNLSHLLNWIK